MVTITEIAEKAQVSPATVSRVLNGKTMVSEEKRRAVNHWVSKLGYKPNHVAQTMVGKKSYLLGVIVTDVSNPFFAEAVRALQQNAFLRGYAIVLCNTNAQPNIERQQVNSLLRRKVDGIIIVPSQPTSPTLKTLISEKIPTTVFTQQNPLFDSVSVDHSLGGAMAASHLVTSGHTTLAYFGKKNDSKFAGFRKEALSRGIDPVNIYCIETEYFNFETSSAYNRAKSFFQSEEGKHVTGVFALNDFIAMSVIKAIEDTGLKVPDNVGVIGFDNNFLSLLHRPALTSIAQPIEEMAAQALFLLYQRMIDTDKEIDSVVLHPSVIIRESSSQQI